MRAFGTRAGAAALASLGLLAVGCGEGAPPDVILVVIDTLRADRLGAYGSESRVTPFLDEWAERSTVFPRAYAQSPWTTPSIASLLTSRYSSQHGVIALDSVLPESERTFPEILAEHGYATGGASANPLLRAERGYHQGYDRLETIVLEGEPLLTPTADARRVGRRALRWVDGLAEPRPPVFLYLHFMEPHTPYDPPRPVLERVFGGAEIPDLEETSRKAVLSRLYPPSPGLVGDVKRIYDAELVALDRKLRALFAELERRGLLEHALVIVTSDHGEELGERGLLGHGHSLHEELIRIPLLLRAPGQTRRAEVRAVVSHLDLAPTILDYAGIDPPARFEGDSLRPFVERARAGDGAPPPAPRAVLSELFDDAPHVAHRRAVVRGEEKLLETVGGERHFFSLADDPEERDPEALPPARRAELDALLERLAGEAERGATARETAPLDEEERRRLRDLGYVE